MFLVHRLIYLFNKKTVLIPVNAIDGFFFVFLMKIYYLLTNY